MVLENLVFQKAGELFPMDWVETAMNSITKATNFFPIYLHSVIYYFVFIGQLFRSNSIVFFFSGAYTNHLFRLTLDLGPHDEVPESFEEYADVEFTMPASTVSQTQVRSISVENPNPPEKWVRYIAKYEYKVEIDHIQQGSDSGNSSEWMNITMAVLNYERTSLPKFSILGWEQTQPSDSMQISNLPVLGKLHNRNRGWWLLNQYSELILV